MARIRTIKPQHWGDKELSKISLQAHLLWIATWNFSDDEGVFEADPLFLKSQVFPRRTDIRVEQITAWLDQLTKARFIVPVTHEGDSYYIHRTFQTHQKIDRPTPSIIPSELIRRTLDEYSTNDRRTLVSVEYSNVEYSNPTGNAEQFILDFNSLKSGKFKLTDKVSKSLKARLKEGYCPADILAAAKNCMQDKYHIENPHFLTPEFILRAEKLEKYLNVTLKPETSKDIFPV